MRLGNFAQGLLALFGASNEGKAVSQAADFVQPTTDVGELLESNLYQALNLTQNIATGATAFFTVPTGFIWKLKLIAANVQTGVGVTANDVGPYLEFASSIVARFYLALYPQDLAASQVAVVPGYLPEPIILPPGTVIGIYSSAAVGAPAASLSILVSAMRA